MQNFWEMDLVMCCPPLVIVAKFVFGTPKPCKLSTVPSIAALWLAKLCILHQARRVDVRGSNFNVTH